MSRKSAPDRRSSRGRMVAQLLALGAALAGLFAMHGLSDHGASSHGINAPTSPAVTAMSHMGQIVDDSPGAAEGESMVDRAPSEGSSGMIMAGLCLAVLAGAIVGLVLLRPHRSVVSIRPVALPFAPLRISGRRDRDPPCLFALSVLRT